MAEVTVSSFAEFVEAVAVDGDIVNCPQEAVWDGNIIAPEGYTSRINIRCSKINGNGTTIKNFRSFANAMVKFGEHATTIEELHWIDFVHLGGSYYGTFDAENPRFSEIRFFKCKFSGLSNMDIFMTHWEGQTPMVLDRCSINCENQSESAHLSGFSVFYRYCRIRYRAANARVIPIAYSSVSAGDQPCMFSELMLYSPNYDGSFRPEYFSGCTLRGDLTHVSNITDAAPLSLTVFVNDTFGSQITTVPERFVSVTDNEMRNPTFLRNIGFPIVG